MDTDRSASTSSSFRSHPDPTATSLGLDPPLRSGTPEYSSQEKLGDKQEVSSKCEQFERTSEDSQTCCCSFAQKETWYSKTCSPRTLMNFKHFKN